MSNITAQELEQTVTGLTALKEKLEAKEKELYKREGNLLTKETELTKKERTLKNDLQNIELAHAFLKYVQRPVDREITTAFLTSMTTRTLDLDSHDQLHWLLDDTHAIAIIPQKITPEGTFTFKKTSTELTKSPYGAEHLFRILQVLDSLDLLTKTLVYFSEDKPLVMSVQSATLSIVLAPYDA